MRHLPALDGLVFGYAGFKALLVARAVSRAWRRRCGADRAPLWAAVRPPPVWIRTAFASRSVAYLQFLVRVYHIDIDSAGGREVLRGACIAGAAAKAQWLTRQFRFSVDDRVAGLALACAGGHLPVVKRLVCDSRFKKRDIRPLQTAALPQLCGDRRGLPILQWLVRHFALTARDLPRPAMLAAACAGGQLPTVQWIHARFGRVDLYDPATLALVSEVAHRHGRIEILEWLAAQQIEPTWE